MDHEISLEKAIDSFHLGWDTYPSPVMLLNKKHVVVAVNKMADSFGITPGINCYTLRGATKICPGCKAHFALKQGAGMRKVNYSQELKMVLDSYWIPLDGSKEYYVHYGNDITPYVDAGLFPEMEKAVA